MNPKIKCTWQVSFLSYPSYPTSMGFLSSTVTLDLLAEKKTEKKKVNDMRESILSFYANYFNVYAL